jgi:hypothetical protein
LTLCGGTLAKCNAYKAENNKYYCSTGQYDCSAEYDPNAVLCDTKGHKWFD